MEVHMPEFPSDKDAATKTDKAMTIGLVLAGIVAILILVGSVFNQTSEEHHVNQASTQQLGDDNTKTQ
jgi:hypothetical protein